MGVTERQRRGWGFLRTIRERELDQTMRHIPPGARILEIGAGAGWQARRLSERGFQVMAIDVAEWPRSDARDWPVIIYDGKEIPLPDGAVDVVFSSNVLEHVPHVEAFQQEILRVLAPGGCAIHLLPTPAWRLWTNLATYPAAARKVIDREYRGSEPGAARGECAGTGETPAHSLPARWLRFARNNLWPVRHGAVGSSVTELYYFSRFRWVRLFESAGWAVERVEPNNLFYTGHLVLGDWLDVAWRRALGRLLGSACLLYVLRPRGP